MLFFYIFDCVVISLILLLVLYFVIDLWILKRKQEINISKFYAVHEALVDSEIELRLHSFLLDSNFEGEDQLVCEKCYNARIADPDDELTDENDFSSYSIGNCSDGYSVFLNSGNGKPVEIEVLRWSEERQQQETVAIYRPKFCPECGRPLDEYKRRED